MESTIKSQKTVREKFIQGVVYIFKKWSAFRLALDNNPKILTYYNEDQSVLEINEMLSSLYEEIWTTLNSGSFSGQMLIDELADILYGFINDYFNIILEDQSDSEIAEILIKLYNELKQGKDKMFTALENYKNPSIKYNIEFPILGNQKVIFEKSNDEESEEEDMDISEDEKEEEKKNDNNNNNNKMEEDDDGFVEIKKGKNKNY